jgi:mannose-6-phosphate isomerase-like protein (cupin superfamily)
MPKTQSKPHQLKKSTETYIITNGTGKITVNNETEHVSSGSVIVVPPKSTQYIVNTGTTPLEFYCIVSPPWQKNQDHLIDRDDI